MANHTRREFFGIAGMAAAAAPMLRAAETSAAPRPRPNVIVVLSDDQGYGDIHAEGNDKISTPQLDRMKREGTAFTNFYVCPVCSPTRACVMTGRYNYRGGVTDTFAGVSMLRPGEVTVADVMAEAGYRTAMFGKWHLGENYPMRATDRGFQESLTFNGGTIGNIADAFDNSYSDPVLIHNGESRKYEGYCTDIFFEEAMKFIEQDPNSPFFIYLPLNVVHDPVKVVPEKYLKPYEGMGLDPYTAHIYGMVANMDENLGRMFARLRALDLEKDTIVIFFSDNGPTGSKRYNLGLRASKTSVYEGGIKVPFYVRCPGRVPAGKTTDRIAAHIDLFPTVLDICDVSRPYGLKLDGSSLWPLMAGKDVSWPDRTLFFQQDRPDSAGWDVVRPCTNAAVRGQKYKAVMVASKPHSHSQPVASGDAPPAANQYQDPSSDIYSESVGFGETELYDIEADPDEKVNIAAAHPDLIFAMRNQYMDWFLDVTRGLHPLVANVLGADEAPQITLSPRDLNGPAAPRAPTNWQQVHKAAAGEPDGWGSYAVDARRPGRYEFTYRFGPEGAPGVPTMKAGKAYLRLGRTTAQQQIAAGARSLTFRVSLDAGRGSLEAILTGQRSDGGAVAPFFIDVKYLGA